MSSWLSSDRDSGYTLQNLPYGVFTVSNSRRHIGIAIASYVLDLHVLATEHVLDGLGFDATTLLEPTLNNFASLGKSAHRSLRTFLQELLKTDTSFNLILRDNHSLRSRALIREEDTEMHLPMNIGDYTDFFVGPHHAANVSTP